MIMSEMNWEDRKLWREKHDVLNQILLLPKGPKSSDEISLSQWVRHHKKQWQEVKEMVPGNDTSSKKLCK